MKLKHEHTQLASTVLGLAAAAFGFRNGWIAGADPSQWDMWTVVATFVPLLAGYALMIREPTKRAVQWMAPYVPWLEDPDDG